MTPISSRSYRGVSDLPALIALAQSTSRAPRPSYYHPGDFVWQLFATDATDDARLWLLDDGTAVACAVFEPPLTFQFVVDSAHVDEAAITSDIVAWATSRRRSAEQDVPIPLAYQGLASDVLSTWVMADDTRRAHHLTAAGFRGRGVGGHRYALELSRPLPEVELPADAVFRPMTDDDAEARSELHRDAWSVWGESPHTSAVYRRLRSAPLYDPELDVVLEVGGEMVSYCVCWIDAKNLVGYFEPVGTRSSAAGNGYGRAVIREGLRRLRAKGMLLATVGTAAVNAPAQALYASAGLREVGQERVYGMPPPN